ncbi:MAG: XdhC family protein [Armatimonadetes bacterium]|nr:XdhC family protein [Armatimonadota bacterium]
MEIYEKILKLIEEEKRGALITVISALGSTPRKIGAKILINEEGSFCGTIGGGKLEALALEEAKKVIKEDKAKIVKLDLTSKGIGAVCGGRMEIFIEPLKGKDRLYIFGAGHIAYYLSKIACLCGFKIYIVDERPDWANNERFPEAHQILSAEIEQVFEEVKFNSSSYIVIITNSWRKDELILEKSLNYDLKYLGIIGSRQKINTHFKNLINKGFKKSQFDKVFAPIGLKIGAYTPAEISISILAQMIALRNEAKIS